MNTEPPMQHLETPPARGGGAMRLRGLIRKEFYQILRDPSSIAIAFLLPVVLLLVFGYGVSLDAEHVPVALVVEQPSADTASFTSGFEQSRYFQPVYMRDMHEAQQALMNRQVSAIVHLRANFARQLRQPDSPRGVVAGGGLGDGPAYPTGQAPVQVIVNGVDANTGRLILGYVQGVWQKWLQRRALDEGQTLNVPVQLETRIWFNSELRSRNFLVPGLIAIIMTLIGALLTALVMAREWERGTMEALMVTPVTMREVLVGKLVPYFILGMGGMALSVAMGVWLFGVPLRGVVWNGGAVSAGGIGHGPADFDGGQKPVRGRTGRHHRHLPAGFHPVGFHLRHRQHADGCSVAYVSTRRALFRGDSANDFSRGQRVVGDFAQRAGAGGDGGLFHRRQPAQTAETTGIGLRCCNESWP